jgi:hypothetical protein
MYRWLNNADSKAAWEKKARPGIHKNKKPNLDIPLVVYLKIPARTNGQAVEKGTAGVSCSGWERGLAVRTKKCFRSEQAPKSGAYRPIRCTHCWAAARYFHAKFCILPISLRRRNALCALGAARGYAAVKYEPGSPFLVADFAGANPQRLMTF